ncbi:MAG TPA: SUMF1/EgtB/PvdO family nonheme iron enzyme, partial [Planctomycetota bacterium]|nr:SUMF1/EgtB/PvdO family nonheme iron enzyme [Planctomycetota bacterium]
EPLIADLGLAKHFTLDSPGGSQSISLSLKGEARGTPGYMAPEQAASATEAGPEADVFALGAILYECLAGFPAFTGSTIVEIIAKAAEARREPLGRARPDAPRWLVAIVEHALEPSPPDRFADAGAMLEALSRGPPPSRAPLVLGLVVALAVVIVALVLHALPKPAPVPPPPGPTPAVRPPPPPASVPAWFRSLEPKPGVPDSLTPTEAKGEYLSRVDGSVFLYVPETRCTLGAPLEDVVASPQELPPYDVVLSPFFVSKFKVTHAQFARFVAETGYRTKVEGPLPPAPQGDARDWDGPHVTELGMSTLSYFAEPSASWQRPSGSKGPPAKDDDPVVQVFWEDALEYGKWVGGTLPSESQWECVARWNPKTGHADRFPWGDEPPDETKARYFHVSPIEEHPRPVPLGPAHEALNVSPLGAVQVAGNAREWILDDMSPNHEWLAGKNPPLRDPVFKQQQGRPYYHVAKGGSIREGGDHLRGAFRQTARGSDDRTSFRLVISPR